MHDNCPPFDDDIAEGIIESEINKTLKEVFKGGRIIRVAAASLGQVYKGTLIDGGEVVAVKVQRPGIQESVGLDLYIARLLCRVADFVLPRVTNQQPYHVNLCDVFCKGSWEELDYVKEAENQGMFKRELQSRGVKVIIPNVHGNFSSRKVLTTGWVQGVKLSTCNEDVINQLIPLGVELFLTQLLDIGKFHSDPHPGNLLVVTRSGGEHELALIDFGLCANVDPRERRAMTTAIVHLLKGEYEVLIREDAKELGFLKRDVDTRELEPVLTKVLREGLVESGSNLRNRKRKLMAISGDLNEIFFNHEFTVPPFFALVTRGLGLLEGIALKGDEEFDIFKAAMPYAKRRAKILFGYNG